MRSGSAGQAADPGHGRPGWSAGGRKRVPPPPVPPFPREAIPEEQRRRQPPPPGRPRVERGRTPPPRQDEPWHSVPPRTRYDEPSAQRFQEYPDEPRADRTPPGESTPKPPPRKITVTRV